VKIMQFMASSKLVGAERSFLELCNELSKTQEVVAVVVKECEFKDRFDSRVKVVELKSNPSRYNPFLYLELRKVVKEFVPDIFHSHSAKATQIAYRLWRKERFNFVATKRNSKKAPIFQKVPNLVAVSKEALNSTPPTKNQRRKVIYNAIEPKPLTSPPKEKIFTLLAIGALREVKGFRELILEVSKLPFEFRLWIVGEGEERESLEKEIQRLGLKEKVNLLGWREDTHLLQQKAHLQVINSKREGFSRVLIEGLFYSDLVISTPVGGSVEILPPKFLFTSLANKVNSIYRNYESYKREFQTLKEKLQPNFLLQESAKNYLKFYQQILKGDR